MLTGLKRGKKKKASSAAAAAATTADNSSAAQAFKAALQSGQALTTPNTTKEDGGANSATTSTVMISTHAAAPVTALAEETMTVTQLAAQERRSHDGSLWDEEMRHLQRAARHKRRKVGKVDSDEEWKQQQHQHHVSNQKKENATATKMEQRWQARQLALHDQQQKLAERSWWWMDSSRFDAQAMVSLSPHTSLVLAPKSWHDDAAKFPHLYLVPRATTASGAACDLTTTWTEVQHYQASLRQWAAHRGQAVIFAEVVLPSKSSNAFYQARLHAMVVPRKLQQDAPLMFGAALQDLVLDHGTHQKKIIHLGRNTGKALPQLVPSHFAYLYVEWDVGQGSILILEEASRDVTADWPLQVLRGRLGLDPLRMRRRDSSSTTTTAERVAALKFGDFDWTLEKQAADASAS